MKGKKKDNVALFEINTICWFTDVINFFLNDHFEYFLLWKCVVCCFEDEKKKNK